MESSEKLKRGSIIQFSDETFGIFACYHKMLLFPELFFWLGKTVEEAKENMKRNPKGYCHGMLRAKEMWREACWTTPLKDARKVGNILRI